MNKIISELKKKTGSDLEEWPPSWILESNLFEIWVECVQESSMEGIVEKNSTFAFVSNLGVILSIFRRPFLKMAASGQENENFGWPNI